MRRFPRSALALGQLIALATVLAASPLPPDPGDSGASLAPASSLASVASLAPVALQDLASAIGPPEAREAIAGISARADASGPRGAFVSEIVSLADGRAHFRLTKGGEFTDLLVGAGAPLQRDGGGGTGAPVPALKPALKPADAAMEGFVRGHEVHRMLLDLERRFRVDARAPEPGCAALRGADDLEVTICRAAEGALPATIELVLPAALGGGSTTLVLSDWRALHGVRLPFAVEFLHADERHVYRYTEVLPFRLAPGWALPAAPDLLLARLRDLAELAAAHERVLEGHRRSDAQMFLADAPERSLSSGRGVLKETGRDEMAARLGPYLAGIRFSRYEDVELPVVAVSADGTLGWLACQIEAAGTSRETVPAPIAYGFSWVELYARTEGGRWQSIGNASSARP